MYWLYPNRKINILTFIDGVAASNTEEDQKWFFNGTP